MTKSKTNTKAKAKAETKTDTPTVPDAQSTPRTSPTVEPEARHEHRFDFGGGHPCLDFANTADYAPDPDRPGAFRLTEENMGAYDDLLAWSRQAGLLSDRASLALRAAAARQPDAAAAALTRAHAFRAAVYATVAATAAGLPADPAAVADVNAEVALLLAASRLVPDAEAGAFALARPGEADGADPDPDPDPPLDRPLWPVVRSAIALLTAPNEVSRVHSCAKDTCGWLFFDPSGRRRWCSMATCGNSEKVRRFRARHKATG